MQAFGPIVLAVLFAADAPEDAARQELAKFQGDWQLVSAVRDGVMTPVEDARKITLSIQGIRFVLRKDGVVLSEGTMTLDPTQRPKAIQETIASGPNKGKVFSAIYEIDDQHHRICFAAPGKERPSAFASPPGSGQVLQVWRRKK